MKKELGLSYRAYQRFQSVMTGVKLPPSPTRSPVKFINVREERNSSGGASIDLTDLTAPEPETQPPTKFKMLSAPEFDRNELGKVSRESVKLIEKYETILKEKD